MINSGTAGLRAESFQHKARIAANSRSIGKICNAVMEGFRRQAAFHELITGSLS
jgi:hypothetical protein